MTLSVPGWESARGPSSEGAGSEPETYLCNVRMDLLGLSGSFPLFSVPKSDLLCLARIALSALQLLCCPTQVMNQKTLRPELALVLRARSMSS